jgi:hypothetical protein
MAAKRPKKKRQKAGPVAPEKQVGGLIGGFTNTERDRMRAAYDKKSVLSQTDIAWLWIIEGGAIDKADEASAVSMAESGGKAKVYNGSCCYGIYQFHHLYFPVDCAKKPSCATKMAIQLSNNGTSWDGGKWEAHENGEYKKYLGKSKVGTNMTPAEKAKLAKIAGNENLESGLGIIPGLKDNSFSIGDIVGFVARLFEPSFWLRVGKGLMGFLLLMFGALTLMKVLVGVEIPLSGPTGFLKKQVASAAGA